MHENIDIEMKTGNEERAQETEIILVFDLEPNFPPYSACLQNSKGKHLDL